MQFYPTFASGAGPVAASPATPGLAAVSARAAGLIGVPGAVSLESDGLFERLAASARQQAEPGGSRPWSRQPRPGTHVPSGEAAAPMTASALAEMTVWTATAGDAAEAPAASESAEAPEAPAPVAGREQAAQAAYVPLAALGLLGSRDTYPPALGATRADSAPAVSTGQPSKAGWTAAIPQAGWVPGGAQPGPFAGRTQSERGSDTARPQPASSSLGRLEPAPATPSGAWNLTAWGGERPASAPPAVPEVASGAPPAVPEVASGAPPAVPEVASGAPPASTTTSAPPPGRTAGSAHRLFVVDAGDGIGEMAFDITADPVASEAPETVASPGSSARPRPDAGSRAIAPRSWTPTPAPPEAWSGGTARAAEIRSATPGAPGASRTYAFAAEAGPAPGPGAADSSRLVSDRPVSEAISVPVRIEAVDRPISWPAPAIHRQGAPAWSAPVVDDRTNLFVSQEVAWSTSPTMSAASRGVPAAAMADAVPESWQTQWPIEPGGFPARSMPAAPPTAIESPSLAPLETAWPGTVKSSAPVASWPDAAGVADGQAEARERSASGSATWTATPSQEGPPATDRFPRPAWFTAKADPSPAPLSAPARMPQAAIEVVPVRSGKAGTRVSGNSSSPTAPAERILIPAAEERPASPWWLRRDPLQVDGEPAGEIRPSQVAVRRPAQSTGEPAGSQDTARPAAEQPRAATQPSITRPAWSRPEQVGVSAGGRRFEDEGVVGARARPDQPARAGRPRSESTEGGHSQRTIEGLTDEPAPRPSPPGIADAAPRSADSVPRGETAGGRAVRQEIGTAESLARSSSTGEPGVEPDATPPRRAEAIGAQAAYWIRASLRAGRRESVVTLDPPQLGRLKVTLRAEGDRLTARIVAELPEVESLLRQGGERIRERLESQGVRIDQLVIDPAPSRIARVAVGTEGLMAGQDQPGGQDIAQSGREHADRGGQSRTQDQRREHPGERGARPGEPPAGRTGTGARRGRTGLDVRA